MSESVKSETLTRRLALGIFERWEQPLLDVGAGPDTPAYDWPARLARMSDLRIERVRWEREHGDAATLPGVEPESFGTVYASHLLEHLDDPLEALARWVRVVRPGGRVFVAVPHRRLYECGKASPPSYWSPEHVWFFNPERHGPEGSRVLGLAQLLLVDLPKLLAPEELEVRLEYLATCDWGYFRKGDAHPGGEYQIEASLVRVS